MPWDWNARAGLPVDARPSGTTGGGRVGSDTSTKAWPRYEAEYLKRALTSERYKYDTEGLDDQQKGVYLDNVVKNYKAEADECLKAEFEQWLEGRHECNEGDREYVNADGRPVRRWVARTPESMENGGGSKVGQARAGWRHTPWGRASLTHLPGVREYLRKQKEAANNHDVRMQLLAEFGPQDAEQAWLYFKHWVKGRPYSDAVAVAPPHDTMMPGARSDFGHQAPLRMQQYDSEPSDRQPGVRAADEGASEAAVALPGDPPKPTATDREVANLQDLRRFREDLEDAYGTRDIREREEAAVAADAARSHQEDVKQADVAYAQRQHHVQMT